jgi:hypothetical protein
MDSEVKRICPTTKVSIPECACPSCHERMMREQALAAQRQAA